MAKRVSTSETEIAECDGRVGTLYGNPARVQNQVLRRITILIANNIMVSMLLEALSTWESGVNPCYSQR
jgi:hypothetical protein